ncbi:MAG TPA: hypothetical protein VMT55_00890, partial [Candidatus Sulfotelmatobacter sp.]|nr:hypothetical protein [Candidatus Sulfotelmatobacter sp.]
MNKYKNLILALLILTFTLSLAAPALAAVPTVTSFSLWDTTSGSTSFTNDLTVGVSIAASADVAAWFMNASGTTPAANDQGWVTVQPATFTFPTSTTDGTTKYAYLWVKNAAGNVSARYRYALDLDRVAPTFTTGLSITDQNSGSTSITGSRTVCLSVAT